MFLVRASPGRFYMKVDRSYGDLANPSVKAHAYMNIVEVIVAWLGIWLVSEVVRASSGDDVSVCVCVSVSVSE
jgi:hypothetical protein